MINLRINNNLLSGLVGRVIEKIIRKKFGMDASIITKDIQVVMEGATTKIHVDASLAIPTTQVEDLIKKNMF